MSRRRPPSPIAAAAPRPEPELADVIDFDAPPQGSDDEEDFEASHPGPAEGGVAPQQTGLTALTVPPEAQGMRLDAWLGSAIPTYSRSHHKGMIEQGAVHVDGLLATSASRKVSGGQVIEVRLQPTAQSQAFVAEEMDLPIVFEDPHLLVVNKPAGLVVHPAAGNWTGTLMNGLLAHHTGAAALPRAGIVHRLDKDTSGLMVVGKTLEAVTALSRAIAARDVKRQYLAIAHGCVPEAMSVDAPIGRDPATRVRMAVVASGKPARTDVQRLVAAEVDAAPGTQGRAGGASARWFSGVWCTLHTGRTHQIRVHLSSRRHPLVSDAVYGGGAALGLTRQALHAARLGFVHPVSGEALSFDAPLPPDMAAAWSMLDGLAGQAAKNQTGV